LAPDLLATPSLFDEAELPVQGDRRVVVREHAEAQLVQTAGSPPLDRRGHQRRADASTAAVGGDHHPDLAETEAGRLDTKLPNDLAGHGCDECPVQLPACRPPLDVDRRLGGNAVAFLGHCGEELGERAAVSVLSGSNFDRLCRHASILPTGQRGDMPPAG
jgi:hypothetical protein